MQTNSTEVNFDLINRTLHNQAYEALSKKNVVGLMICVDSKKHLRLLEDNIHSFLHHGIYEEALFTAMTGGSHCHPERWSDLICYADLEKLRSIGDPIPTKPVTVYRGVAYTNGAVDSRGKIYSYEELKNAEQDIDVVYEMGDFIFGYSWTLNKHTAAWFANRLPNRTANLSGEGAVFYAKINPEDILFYDNDRGEEEVVVDIGKLPQFLPCFEVMPEPIQPR